MEEIEQSMRVLVTCLCAVTEQVTSPAPGKRCLFWVTGHEKCRVLMAEEHETTVHIVLQSGGRKMPAPVLKVPPSFDSV